MPIGTVKFFNTDKGYGFIAPEDGGADSFVHISAVQAAGMQTLNKDQRLSYEVERGRALPCPGLHSGHSRYSRSWLASCCAGERLSISAPRSFEFRRHAAGGLPPNPPNGKGNWRGGKSGQRPSTLCRVSPYSLSIRSSSAGNHSSAIGRTPGSHAR